MKKFFVFFIFLFSCYNDDKQYDVNFIVEERKIDFFKKEENTTKIELNITNFINDIYNFITRNFQKVIENEIILCEESILTLKEEWGYSYCDVLRNNAKNNCIEQRKIIPDYLKKVCSIIVLESFRVNFDWLLVLAIIKTESNFGIIKKENDQYYVSQDVCTKEINKENVIITQEQCRKENAKKIEFKKNGNKICAFILEDKKDKLVINTCLYGEAGLLQLITPNYYSNRIIPGTNLSIPSGTILERMNYINNNLEASIKIGIEELIAHRNMFPFKEREKWWFWISSYNTGSKNRCTKQWKKYSTKIYKNYIKICQNENIKRYFGYRCNDLRNYIFFWEEC